MSIDWNLAVTIAMPVVSLLIGALINHLVESRPKLISHLGFISSHRMDPLGDGTPMPVVNTHSIVLRNIGRKAATNVRLTHYFLPNVNVHPDTAYELRNLPGGGKEMVFPTLAPKKEISVNYLYFAPDTWDKVNLSAESDEGPAKIVNVLLQPQRKQWVSLVIWGFAGLGFATLIYLGVIGFRWLAT